jgi:NADH dehydrogenase FAD-containing subunit
MREEIAHDSVTHLKHYLLERLGNRKVEILTRTKVVAFDTDSVIVEDRRGRRKLCGYDHLVVAMGSKSSPLADSQFGGKVEKILVIGDARIPGEIIDAVRAGYDLSSQMA